MCSTGLKSGPLKSHSLVFILFLSRTQITIITSVPHSLAHSVGWAIAIECTSSIDWCGTLWSSITKQIQSQFRKIKLEIKDSKHDIQAFWGADNYDSNIQRHFKRTPSLKKKQVLPSITHFANKLIDSEIFINISICSTSHRYYDPSAFYQIA